MSQVSSEHTLCRIHVSCYICREHIYNNFSPNDYRSAMAESGYVKLVRGAWIKDFLDELELFPQEGVHDDQVTPHQERSQH